MSSQQYYIQLGGRVSGPFTAAELATRAKRGRFARHFMVSIDKVQWTSAAEHPEFFPGSEGFVAARPELSGQEWFYARDGQEVGPISRGQLFSMISSGQIGPDDQVWTEGMLDWEEVWMVPRLAALVGDGLLVNGSPLVLNAPRQRYSTMAILSLVFGILGATILFLLGSLVAVILGHKALREIDESYGWLTGRSLARAGLALGYVALIPGSVALFILSSLLLGYVTAGHGRVEGAHTRIQQPGSGTIRPVGGDFSSSPAKGEDSRGRESRPTPIRESDGLPIDASQPNALHALSWNRENLESYEMAQFDSLLVGVEGYEVIQPRKAIPIEQPVRIFVWSKADPSDGDTYRACVTVKVQMAPLEKSLTVDVRLESPTESMPPIPGDPLPAKSFVPVSVNEIAKLRDRYSAEEKACRKYLEEHWKGADLAKRQQVTAAEPIVVMKEYEQRQQALTLAVAGGKWCDRVEELLRYLQRNGRLHVRAYAITKENKVKRQVELVSTKGFPTEP